MTFRKELSYEQTWFSWSHFPLQILRLKILEKWSDGRVNVVHGVAQGQTVSWNLVWIISAVIGKVAQFIFGDADLGIYGIKYYAIGALIHTFHYCIAFHYPLLGSKDKFFLYHKKDGDFAEVFFNFSYAIRYSFESLTWKRPEQAF